MYRSLHPPQVLLTLASVVYLFVATLFTAQVQTSALVYETGARGGPPSSGLSAEEWRAITRYIEGDQPGVKWTAESGPGELLNEDAKLLASDAAWGASFGWSVAVSGDTVVVGAHVDSEQGWASGSAYVFEKSAGGWSGTLGETAKLLASDGAGGDTFGTSVAISGNTVVVGAVFDNDQGSTSGSTYVFEKPAGGWSGTLNENAKLLASDGASGDQFGFSVAVSGDTVVVGACRDDELGRWSGSAYIFEKPSGGWSGTLSEDAKLLASDGASDDWFGTSVAVSGDTVVVGAWGDDDLSVKSGSTYVFEKPGGGWSGTLNEDAKLLASDGAVRDLFGWSVGISRETVVVGAKSDDDQGDLSGSAYVFERPSGGWSGTLSEDAKLLASDGSIGDQFGLSVAVSGDTVVVGVRSDDDLGSTSGSAYVFEKPSGGWSGTLSENAKLLASDGASDDWFGYSVAVSGDTVTVGAPLNDDHIFGSGSAYVFVRADSDSDGVPDGLDICTDTAIPETVPTVRLGANRFALVDDDGLFDTTRAPGTGPGPRFSIGDTGGCSCEQIIDALDASPYQVKFGCTIGTMRTWADFVSNGTDSDADRLPDILDVCPDTAIPEAVPTMSLGANRFALVNEDTVFDTNRAPGIGPGSSFSIGDTGGCSCDQIIDALDASPYQVKFGCTIGTMRTWVDSVSLGPDSDGDTWPDILDICPDTAIPEAVPTVRLGANRFALVNDDTVFDTNRAPGTGPGPGFSIGDTGGCSCEQIIDVLDASRYQVKFGCTIGTMKEWVDLVNP